MFITNTDPMKDSIGKRDSKSQEDNMAPKKRNKLATTAASNRNMYNWFVTNIDINLWLLILTRAINADYKCVLFMAENLIIFQKFDPTQERHINSLVEAKHRHDDRKKIAYDDLICKEDGEFSLFKYFSVYCKIRKDEVFERNVVKEFVIYTNSELNVADVEMNSISVHKTELDDDILFSAATFTAAKYNFSVDEACELYSELLGICMSELHEVARVFVTQICTKNQLTTTNDLIKRYKSVFFGEGIIDRDNSKLSEDFCNDKLPNVREFRALFEREGRQILKNKNKSFWSSMRKRKLTWSKEFNLTPVSANAKFPIAKDLLNEFLKNFSIISYLPDKGERNSVMRNDLAENILETSLMCYDFTKKLLDWVGKEVNVANTWMEHLESNMSALIVAYINRNIEYSVSDIKFNFEQINERIKEFVSDNSDETILFLESGDYERFSTAKVIQVLQRKSIENYIVVNLDMLLKIQHIYRTACNDKKFAFFIVECSSGDSQWLFNEYNNVFESLNAISSKLFLISDNENLFTNLFTKKGVVSDRTKFTDLNIESRNALLSREIYFQGVCMSLEDIVKDELDVVTDSLLTQLYTHQSIYINDNNDWMVEMPDYIERTFNQSISFTESELIEKITKLPKIVVAVYGYLVDVQQLNAKIDEPNRFVTYTKDSKDELREKYVGSDIALVKRLQFNLKYKIKEIISDTPEKYCHLSSKSFSVSALTDNALAGQKIILIADEPGSGKSVVLNSLAKSIHEKDRQLWISKINFANSMHFLKKASDRNPDDFESLLVDLATGNCSEFYEIRMFCKKYDDKQVVLLLDGLDEIPSEYHELVANLLNFFLKHLSNIVIFVTRPHHRFATIVNDNHFYLKPWDLVEQKSYLKTVWFRDIVTNASTDDSFQLFFDALRRLILSHKRNVDTTSSPMILSLMAQIFKKDFLKFYHSLHITDLHSYTNTYNLASLYEKFVSLKFEEHKANYMTAISDEIDTKSLEQSFVLMRKALQNQALKYIRYSNPDEYLQLLDESAEKLIANIELVSLGLLHFTDDELTHLQFVHFSFVEYFIAKAFAEKTDHYPDYDEKLFKISPNVKTFYNLLRASQQVQSNNWPDH